MNATMQDVATPTRLTVDDLRTFDSDATKLVMEMQSYGWTGYMTNRGHAFMLAPDGSTTASVTRDSLRGRSGRNARAQLTRWQRAQRQAAEQAPGSSFGTVQFGDPGVPPWGDRRLPTATMLEIRRSEQMAAYMREHGEDPARDLRFVAPADLEQRPRAWAGFDARLKGQPLLIARGSAMPEDEAWQLLYALNEDLRAPEHDSTTFDTHTPEDQAMKVFVCKDCSDQFDSLGSLGAHVQTQHGGGRTWTCEHEGCGKTFGTAGGLNLHRNGAHPSEVTCTYEGCDYTTTNKGALARHRVSVHGLLTKKAQREKDLAGEVTITHVEPREPVEQVQVLVGTPGTDTGDSVTVTSSPAPDEPSGDVLMDYLLSSPSGEDAEDLVARVRAVVSAPIVTELRRVREENALLREQNEKLNRDNGDLEAKLSMLREALSV